MIMEELSLDASHKPICGCPGLAATALAALLLGLTAITSDVTPPSVNTVALVCRQNPAVNPQGETRTVHAAHMQQAPSPYQRC